MGQTDEHLPVDMRQRSSGGVGAGARENRQSAVAHEAARAAMPRGREPEAVEADADETVEATEATKAADVKKSKCPRCGAVAESEHNYCHKCGDDLGRRTPQQML
ncbi:hypothetical protein DRQ25_12730, partial [Candidatus Fermentibacteria bacterium]